MSLAEFKAWLEGYGASFADGVPNADQWAEVQKRLSGVHPLSLAPFAPYGPRPNDTMTKPLEMIRPYYVGDPPPGVPDLQPYPTVTWDTVLHLTDYLS